MSGEAILHQFSSAKADGPDATLVQPSDWNAKHTSGEELVNNSGAQVVANDVLVQDTATNSGLVASTTVGDLRAVAVALATINNAVSGYFAVRGLAVVAVQGAVTRGQHLRVSATSKKLEAVPNSQNTGYAVGSVGIARTAFAGPGAGTVECLLWGTTFQPIGLKGVNLASAAALQLDASADYFHVTGTTTITSISGRPAGSRIVLEFEGSLQFTNGASLQMLNAADAAFNPGDLTVLISEGSNVWREVVRSSIGFDPQLKSEFYEDFFSQSANFSAVSGTYITGGGAWRHVDVSGVSLLNPQGVIGGVVRFTGSAFDFDYLYTGSGPALAFSSSKNPVITLRAAQGDATAGTRRFGLGADGATDFTTDPDNGIYVRHSAGGNLIAVCRSSNTESTLDTGVAAANGTFHTIQLRVFGTTQVQVFVDNVSKGTISTNIPTAVLGAFFMSTGGSLDMDLIHVRQDR